MPKFKKPKDVEDFIQAWGWMDDLIIRTKKKTAYNYWMKNGTPNGIKYDYLVVNRYWYKNDFEEELKMDYTRIYKVFIEAMSI
jgi:hypothetical protein